MIKKKIFITVFVLTMFSLTGCTFKPAIIPYSFAENESETAVITFMRKHSIWVSGSFGVRLIDYDGIEIPFVDNRTEYWQQVTLPAGKPLNLRVFMFYSQDIVGNRRRGIFKCPPLEAGKSYKLWNRENRKLILTDAGVKEPGYVFGTPSFEIIHEQNIPQP